MRPARPFFSSGPCAKRPGWTPEAPKGACLSRSHRSKQGKAKLKEAIDRTRKVLGVPQDYRIAIVAGSDTGAVEMALWSLLGVRGVDVLAWEAFTRDWVIDIVEQLKLRTRARQGGYGALPISPRPILPTTSVLERTPGRSRAQRRRSDDAQGLGSRCGLGASRWNACQSSMWDLLLAESRQKARTLLTCRRARRRGSNPTSQRGRGRTVRCQGQETGRRVSKAKDQHATGWRRGYLDALKWAETSEG